MYKQEPFFVFQPSSHLTESDLNIEDSLFKDDDIYCFTKEERYSIEEDVLFNRFEKNDIQEEDEEYSLLQFIQKKKEVNEYNNKNEKKEKKEKDNFYKMLEHVKKYKKEYGIYPVSNGNRQYEGHDLYSWLLKNRKLYFKGKLQEEYQNELENLEGWVWDYTLIYTRQLKNKKWMEKYVQLKKRKKNTSVMAWVLRQKRSYINKTLDKEYIELLEKIPKWSWNIKNKSK